MVQGHFFSRYDKYGYGEYDSKEKLTAAIVRMYEEMVLPAIPKGLCGCVYTQLSDVEDEVNGLYTYDRQICKVDKQQMQEVGKRVKQGVNE